MRSNTKPIAAQLEPGSHLRRDFSEGHPCLVALHVREHGEGAWKNLSGRLSEKFGARV